MEELNDVITSEMPSLKAELHSLPTLTTHVHRLWLDICTDIIYTYNHAYTNCIATYRGM